MSFFKLLHISKHFSSLFIEKDPRVSGPTRFRFVLFKVQLYFAPSTQLAPIPNYHVR